MTTQDVVGLAGGDHPPRDPPGIAPTATDGRAICSKPTGMSTAGNHRSHCANSPDGYSVRGTGSRWRGPSVARCGTPGRAFPVPPRAETCRELSRWALTGCPPPSDRRKRGRHANVAVGRLWRVVGRRRLGRPWRGLRQGRRCGRGGRLRHRHGRRRRGRRGCRRGRVDRRGGRRGRWSGRRLFPRWVHDGRSEGRCGPRRRLLGSGRFRDGYVGRWLGRRDGRPTTSRRLQRRRAVREPCRRRWGNGRRHV